ncbi:heat shock 70 kDa protein 16-like protein, partial [Tanacetum coccineum]
MSVIGVLIYGDHDPEPVPVPPAPLPLPLDNTPSAHAKAFLGIPPGAAFATANPKSTISQIKRLIGRQYNEPSVQEDLKFLPFVTSEGPRGGILIELEYMKEKMMFTPVEILGMLFKHLKQIAEKNLESAVVDCVIGIPSYFTDLQRREYLDAATIAGLKP